jgi:hypothetical protein
MGRNEPASGERRATSGYRGQYRVAADLIYRSLREGTLTWIGLADLEAGRVDDLQIGSQGRVDAYQVKWSQFVGSVSFNDLVATPSKAGAANSTVSAPKPCLIAQLADGWSRLRSKHPGQRVVVHLITNDVPSKNANPPAGNPRPSPPHFAAFLAQAWNPARTRPSLEPFCIPAVWKPAWKRLEEASGLESDQFALFSFDLELDLGFVLSSSDSSVWEHRPVQQEDRLRIEKFLFDTIGDAENITTLSREELIFRLGWGDRFRPRSRHDFPSPAFSYLPILPTQKALDERLDALRGGYLAVLGPPGSGKSTLLTETLRSRPERIIRYYAYVPDAIEPDRGESSNFLHDIVIAIERAGFHFGDSIPGRERLDLTQRLHGQLQLLHCDFAKNGRKTVILVDGLDHIDREQHPERSLLHDLPVPNSVPEGVIFLLGSQTVQLPDLPTAVSLALRESARCIQMQPLPSESALLILDRASLPVELSPTQRERLLDLAEGHPLSLEYLMNRLITARSPQAVEEILADEVGFGGDIRNQYHAFWQRRVKDCPAFVRLLGLLGCLRGAIDLEWIESWADEAAVTLLRERAAHYFREEPGRWYFYHNSFRQFLLERVTERSAGQSDTQRIRPIHAELASRCAGATKAEIRWEELFHRIQAGEYDSALRLASQQQFRGQFLELRPGSLIRADIERVLRVATERRDIVALGRLLLAFVECDDRSMYLADVPLASMLLEVEEIDRAIRYARMGNRLLVGAAQALQMARLLAERGFHEEGKRLFGLAEPLDVLFSGNEINYEDGRGHREILREWADTAPLFRPIGEVIATLGQLRFKSHYLREESSESWNLRVRSQIVFDTGLRLLKQKRWDDISHCLDALSSPDEEHRRANRWLRVRTMEALISADETVRARGILDELLSESAGALDSLDSGFKLLLAENLLFLARDEERARTISEILDVPMVGTMPEEPDRGWEILRSTFRIARLRFYLGDTRSIDEIVPLPDDLRLRPIAFVMRDIVRIARIAARGKLGSMISRPELKSEFSAALRRFNIDRSTSRVRHDWFSLLPLRERIYTLLVQTAGMLGTQALEMLLGMFEHEWFGPDTAKHWYVGLKRSIILALVRAGASRSWAIAQLGGIERDMLEGLDVNDRVRACQEQIEAYLALGETRQARHLLDQTVRTAIGVGARKDYQLDSWLDWLDRALDLEPEKAEERLAWFARAAVSLCDTTERGYRSASLRLVEIVARRNLNAAVRLVLWFHKHRVLTHEDALAAVLSEALRGPTPPIDLVLAMTGFILIPYSASAKAGLVRQLLSSLRSRSRPDAIAGARTMVENACRFAPRSARNRWFEAIREALDVVGIERWAIPIPNHPAPPEDDRSSHDVLVQTDGTKLKSEEVLARISTIDDLLVLAGSEFSGDDHGRERSFFDWSKAIRKVAPSIDITRIRELARAFRGQWRETYSLVELSRRALQLGDRELAASLAAEAIECSSHFGWDRYSDGGSRLEAFECLIEIQPTTGREEAWKRFRDDFHSENYYRSRFVYNLDRLAKLLLGETPVRELYVEIEEHVRSLFDGAPLPEGGPELGLTGTCGQNSPESAIFDFIEFHLVHPAPWVMQAAWRCVGHLVRQRAGAAERLIPQLLTSQEIVQESALPVIEAISAEDPALLAPFQDQILALLDSQHGGLRCVVRRIARRSKWDIVVPETPVIPAPSAIYRLSLSPVGLKDPEEIAEELDGRGVRGTQTAEVLLMAQRPRLEETSRVTGIPSANLVARSAQIMAELDPSQAWTEEAESRLRGWLEKMGSRFTYRKPVYLSGRRASHHLLAELEDLGIIDEKALSPLCTVYRWYDPLLAVRMPSERPSSIEPMGEERIANHDRWLRQIEEAFPRLSLRCHDGRIVLAEETTLARPIWEDYREKRQALLVSEVRPTFPEKERFFPSLMVGIVEKYHSYGTPGAPPPLVRQNVCFDEDAAGGEWLALNPWVGNELGWTLASDGLFRWLDRAGRIMAETIHWVDGPIALSPYQDEEVGEGFLVLLDMVGLRSIVNRWGPLTRIVRLRRGYRDDGVEHEEVRTKMVPWIGLSLQEV